MTQEENKFTHPLGVVPRASGRDLTRRELLKSVGAVMPGLVFPDLLREWVSSFTDSSPPAEEIPGGVNLDLSKAETDRLISIWKEVKEQREFPRAYDYLVYIVNALNYAFASGISDEDFVKFMANEVVRDDISIGEKSLFALAQIRNIIPDFSRVRDEALRGRISTAEYGIWATAFMQFIMANCVFMNDFPESLGSYYTGGNWLAYINFVPKKWMDGFVPKNDFYSQLTVYHVDSFPFGVGGQDPKIFDLQYSTPRKGLRQTQLTSSNDLSLGDIVFRDTRKTGHRFGHPISVLYAKRNRENKLENFVVFDPNIEGRMIAGVFGFGHAGPEDDFIRWYGGGEPIGVLRTGIAEQNLLLRRAFYDENAGVMPLGDIPPYIRENPPYVVPDFGKDPIFVELWEKSRSPRDRDRAILDIVRMLGLEVRDSNGNVVTGPHWISSKWGGEWICSLYAQYLFVALGLGNDMNHWFVNGKPSFNQGEEYDAKRTFGYLNTFGREHGFIDITDAPKEVIATMSESGYVFYGATPYHNWVILPGGILSQASYNLPYRVPDWPYKYLQPHLARKDRRGGHIKSWDGVLFAHILPGIEEPDSPYRQPLFGFNLSDPNKMTQREMIEEGFVFPLKDLMTYLDAKPSVWNSLLGIQEKVPSEGHYFNVVYTLVETIQRYRLPIGRSASDDPQLFRLYVEKELSKRGYEKLVSSKKFQTALSLVEQWFVTREMSRQTGKPFQPLQCIGLVEMCMAIDGVKDSPPPPPGLTGDAQDIALHLLGLPVTNSKEKSAFFNRDTKVIRFENDVPKDLGSFRPGDVFYVAYGFQGSGGHAGTILAGPFMGPDNKTVVVVADANRISRAHPQNPHKRLYVSDGMPRVRVMDYKAFMREFLENSDGEVNGRMVVIRRSS
jgi:hypothetical protein